MSMITKMALAAFAGLLIGGGVAGAQIVGDDSKTATDTTTTTGETTTTTTGETTTTGIDISGPCDEAEHANDPRCAGAVTDGDEDNSGPGNARHRHGGASRAEMTAARVGPGEARIREVATIRVATGRGQGNRGATIPRRRLEVRLRVGKLRLLRLELQQRIVGG